MNYLRVLKKFPKNTVPFIKKYVVDLIGFGGGLMENWNRKLKTSNPNQGGGERYGSFFEAGR